MARPATRQRRSRHGADEPRRCSLRANTKLVRCHCSGAAAASQTHHCTLADSSGILACMRRSLPACVLRTLFATWFAIAFPIQVALGMPAMGGMAHMDAMGGSSSSARGLACAPHSAASKATPERNPGRQHDSSHECCSAACCCPAVAALDTPHNVVPPAQHRTIEPTDQNWSATCVVPTRSAYARPFATAPPNSIV